MKRDWDPVKTRVVEGDMPEPGDVLEFASGRRYQVLRTNGRTVHSLVLPRDHDAGDARVLQWRWIAKRRKVTR